MAWGVAIGVGAVVLRELVRPREQPARLIDWGRVEEIALARCGEPNDLPADPATNQTYQQIAADLEPLLAGALGPGTAASGSRVYPGLAAVGRRQWVRFNIRIFRQMFEPLEGLQQLIPGSVMMSLGQKGLTRYLGLMLGLLARRVLGQYDPALLGREPVETTSLILVEPNVQAWSQKDKLPIDELRRWLAMHEMTHAWEFKAHPWLQAYLEGPLERAFLRLTGLEMKMRQYVIGERFCREVRAAGGPDLLARVWEGPQWLPTMAEIQRPRLYIERARLR
jgi:uncharacterized protein (DUF2342 family)